jgi:peptide/nickel transport system substrate-binding protein
MAPKHAVEQYGDLKRNIVGTGPFKLKEYTRGQRFVFERNPDYYETGVPYLDQIVLTVIPDAATAVAAFQAGQLDVYPSTFQNLQVIKDSVPNAVVGDYQNLSISGLAVNVKVKPLDDIRVRQAMWYGINQQEIITTVFQGDGVKGRVVPPAYTGWVVPYDQLPLNDAPNLDKAKQLLTEAGLPNGFTVKCATTSQYTEPEATVVAQQLKKIGVTLQLNHMEYGAFLDARDKGNFETLAFGLAPFGDIDDFTSALFQTKASRNWGNWSNEQLDALFAQGKQEADVSKRTSIYAQAQAILAQQNFLIDIPRQNQHMVWHPYVKDYVTAQNPELGLGYYRVWLDK